MVQNCNDFLEIDDRSTIKYDHLMTTHIVQIPVLCDNYTYLVYEPVSKQAICIDPALSDPVLNYLQKNNWQLTAILNTHHHPDHVGGNLDLKRATSCKIYGPDKEKNAIPGISCGVKEGDRINFGSLALRVLETPGHTLGHVVYFDSDEKNLFCGDVIFSLGCGRLFEGTAEMAWSSIKKIKNLSNQTRMYCAHEYSLANAGFAMAVDPDNKHLHRKVERIKQQRQSKQPTIPTILGEEKQCNPFLRADCPELMIPLGFNPDTTDPSVVFKKLRNNKDHFHVPIEYVE